MLNKLSKKLRGKLPAAKHGYSVVKFACLDYAFPGVFFELRMPGQKCHKTRC